MSTEETINAVDAANKRAEAIAEASVENLAEILQSYLKTDDGAQLLELRAQAEAIDPMQPIEALAWTATLVKDIKDPGKKLAAAKTKQTKAAAKVEDLKAEAAKVRDEFAAKIRAAAEAADQARDDVADLQLDADRYRTLATDDIAPNCGELSNPVIKAWARLEKLV